MNEERIAIAYNRWNDNNHSIMLMNLHEWKSVRLRTRCFSEESSRAISHISLLLWFTMKELFQIFQVHKLFIYDRMALSDWRTLHKVNWNWHRKGESWHEILVICRKIIIGADCAFAYEYYYYVPNSNLIKQKWRWDKIWISVEDEITLRLSVDEEGQSADQYH